MKMTKHLTASDLQVGERYDLVFRNGMLRRNIQVVDISDRLIMYRLDYPETVHVYNINRTDVGPGQYCEIYPAGIGQTIHDIRERHVVDIRLIKDRVAALKTAGYCVEPRAMGSGGVGQVRITKKEIRVQIGCGYTRWNNAMCVILPNE